MEDNATDSQVKTLFDFSFFFFKHWKKANRKVNCFFLDTTQSCYCTHSMVLIEILDRLLEMAYCWMLRAARRKATSYFNSEAKRSWTMSLQHCGENRNNLVFNQQHDNSLGSTIVLPCLVGLGENSCSQILLKCQHFSNFCKTVWRKVCHDDLCV